MVAALLVRFFRRFVGDFGRTMTEDKMSYAAIPATLLWFWVNRKDLQYDVWIIVGPLIGGRALSSVSMPFLRPDL